MTRSTLIALAVSCVLAAGAHGATIIDLGAVADIYDSVTDGNTITITDPATHADGLTMNVTFTPNAADIASAATAVNLLEIGGMNNGSGLYLLGGEVHFLGKIGGATADTPTFDDLAFDSGNNMVSVKSTYGSLVAGKTYTVAAVYDPITANALKLAVRRQGVSTHVDSYALTGVGSKTNWSGNDTVTNLVGDGSVGAGNDVGGNTFNEVDIRANDFAGTQGQGLLWNSTATARVLGQVALGWTAKGVSDGALATWSVSTNSTGVTPVNWGGGSGGTKQSGATNFANVNDWVNSPAYALQGSGDSWQDVLTNAETQQDATWEIVLRPGDFTGNHMIFNTGGDGSGTGIVLTGSAIEFRFQNAANPDQRNFRTFDLSTVGEATDFFHIVGTADVAGQAEGIGELFVNGVSVDGPVTSAGTINDWDGGDPAGLGGFNFNIPGADPFSADAFTGDIALFNYYSDQILTPELILENYNALIPEPATVGLLAIGGVVLGLRRRRRA